MIILRSQALSSVPPLGFCLQRLLFWHRCRDLRNACFPLRSCLPPGHVVLASGTAQITTSSSRAQPAQTLSPHDFHTCCVFRLFDHLKAMGACRVLPGWKLCKWRVQLHPPADTCEDSVASKGLCFSCRCLLAYHGNLLTMVWHKNLTQLPVSD